MSDQAFTGQETPIASGSTTLTEALLLWRSRGMIIVGSSMLFAAAAIVSSVPFLTLTFFLVSSVLILAAILAYLAPFIGRLGRARALSRYADVLELDTCPSLILGLNRSLMYANAAAMRDKTFHPGMKLNDVLLALGVDAETITPAENGLCSDAAGHECSAKTSVKRLSYGMSLWRFDFQTQDTENPYSRLPTITLGEENVVLHANPMARDLLGSHADMFGLFSPNIPLKLNAINDIRAERGLISCFVHDISMGSDATSDGTRTLGFMPVASHLEDPKDAWSVLEDLPVALLRLSAEGVIELSNRTARVLLGVDSGAGRRLSELMEGPGRSVIDWVRDAAQGRGTLQPEILQMRRKDKDVFVQVTLHPVRDCGKTILVAVLQDATKLKTLELQFVQSQKMQAIGQLAGGVAHDFNNLLTAISGHCDLLLMRHGVDDPTYPDLMQISQNANRAAALVGQLLAYSRKQMLRLEIMSLRDMLSDVTHLLNRLVGEKVTLTLNHDPDLWSVRADKRQLEQVLMNLVVNARDAMPDGGDVVIGTRNLVLNEALKRDRAEVAPGRYVVVSVRDDGEGIQGDMVDKIFEPFYTSKKQGDGTGLGLSTAYGIIKQTGGFIFVDSVPHEGTEFQIYLPAHDAQIPDPALTPAHRTQVEHINGVVMLVEDEAPVRAFALRALKMKGFAVIEAETGEQALGLLEDRALRVDVIVTDVVMPGMDGPTWVREALKTRPDVRVVFVSGYALDSVEDGALPDLSSVFLPKPFSLSELVETVQAQLSSM